MSRKFTLAALAVSGFTLMAGGAGATTIGFSGYQTALNPGEVLVTDFDLPLGVRAGFHLSGTGTSMSGTSGLGAAPAFSASTRDPTQYLSLEAGQSETLTTPLLREISFYVGSLDTYNTVTFHHPGGATEAFGGGTLAATVAAAANGNQQAINSNGRYTFTFASPIDSVRLDSASNSLELSNIGAQVPEPATWAMMLAGAGLVGAALRGGAIRRKPA